MLAQRQSELPELELAGDSLKEDGKDGGDIGQQGVMVAAITQAPGLDEIWEADGILLLLFAGRDLLIAIALQNLEFLGLFVLLFRVVNRIQELLEFDYSFPIFVSFSGCRPLSESLPCLAAGAFCWKTSRLRSCEGFLIVASLFS